MFIWFFLIHLRYKEFIYNYSQILVSRNIKKKFNFISVWGIKKYEKKNKELCENE